jgi:hypothetical protein
MLRTTRLLSKLTVRPAFVNIPTTRTYVKQRKIDLEWKDPEDVFSEAKKKMDNVPRLDDVDIGRQVLAWSSIFDENYAEYMAIKKKGVIPSESIEISKL